MAGPLRSIKIYRPGNYSRLHLTEVAEPLPQPNDVVIDVEAAGVNFADCVIRMGLYQAARDFGSWPITPGFEIAGRVSGCGSRVHDMPLGTRVLAVTRFGGYTARIAVPRRHVYRMPQNMTFTEAAGFPVVFLSAYYALFVLVAPRPGDRLLVHSAAGGVGGALLQLARLAKCVPVAVVGGPHKIETALSLGAAVVIDRSRGNMWSAAKEHAPHGYHAVFDANGPSTFRRSYEQLAPMGRLVVYGAHAMLASPSGRPSLLKLAWQYCRAPRFNPFRMSNENRSIMAFNLAYLFEHDALFGPAMQQLLDWYGPGKLKSPPISVYPLERVADAHRALESGRTVGKLVLAM